MYHVRDLENAWVAAPSPNLPGSDFPHVGSSLNSYDRLAYIKEVTVKINLLFYGYSLA